MNTKSTNAEPITKARWDQSTMEQKLKDTLVGFAEWGGDFQDLVGSDPVRFVGCIDPAFDVAEVLEHPEGPRRSAAWKLVLERYIDAGREEDWV